MTHSVCEQRDGINIFTFHIFFGKNLLSLDFHLCRGLNAVINNLTKFQTLLELTDVLHLQYVRQNDIPKMNDLESVNIPTVEGAKSRIELVFSSLNRVYYSL